MAGSWLSTRPRLLTKEPPAAETQTPPTATTATTVEARVRALFEAHYAAIWRLLRRLGVETAQLDDAAQEVFWVAAKRVQDIQSGSEQAFLYGVALRIASNAHRRRRASPELVSDAELEAIAHPGLNPEQNARATQMRALLDVVLDQLAPELRTVFVLCELEGMEVRDAAALEGIPVGTASSRLRRARQAFSAVSKRVHARLVTQGGL